MAFLNFIPLTFSTLPSAGLRVAVSFGLPLKFLTPTIIFTPGTTANDTFDPNSNFLCALPLAIQAVAGSCKL